ncbi:unnamed protein product [Cercospora beticola]|nr:unnamed protein product [Cercospora beticola]
MDTSRSQQILERMLNNDAFSTDFIIKTKTKAFKVHRAVIDQALHSHMSDICGEREWILKAPNFVAEDFVRHCYGLQVPRLQPVNGSEPTIDQVLQVFELFIEAGKASLWDLESDCLGWINDTLESSSQKAGLLVAIVEYLAKTGDENYEDVWEIKADLVQDIADRMGDILADDEAFLERIFKFKLLRYLVLQELATRSKSLEELEEKLNQSKAE